MKMSSPFPIAAPLERPTRSKRTFLSGFHSIRPRFQTLQTDLLNWLVEAHSRAGGPEPSQMNTLFQRYSASPDYIASRGHELADFNHRRWNEMRLFGPKGSDLREKTLFFEERVNEIFERFYPENSCAPRGIVHVTCTGYASPSGAQRLVSKRAWGQSTQVIHAYHMGCYAAHPAVRIAQGLGEADIVHTELCSLHLDPAQHDPAHLIIQSLFADGFIRYSLSGSPSQGALEVLAARDEIIPDSTEAMAWVTGPLNFTMDLSKEVPVLLASSLPRFVTRLCEEAGVDWAAEKDAAVFAIHPGGPRIIELCQKILGIDPAQARWSRQVLRQHGNMSSATLPHVWQKMLQDAAVPDGTLVISLGAGPGLTLSGMILRKTISRDSER